MKSLRVYFNGSNIHKVITDKMKNGVTSDSQKIITSATFEAEIENLKFKPFFSKKYYVEVIMKNMRREHIKKLLDIEWVQCVFVCSNYREFKTLDEFELVSFSSNYPPDNIAYEYIQKELPLASEEIIKHVRKRVKGQYDMLDLYLRELKIRPLLTTKEINKVIPLANRLTFDQFFMAILICDFSRKRKVFKMLDTYRYASNFILKFLKEKMEETMKLYKEFHEGYLNRNNIKDFHRDNSEYSEYKLEFYVELFENVSLDELLLIEEEIFNCKEGRYNLVSLIYKIYFRRRLD